MGKPRWKILIELGIAIAGFFIGGVLLIRASDVYPDQTSLIWAALGVLVIWVNGDRIKEHWNEL